MKSLFSHLNQKHEPLAQRMRARSLLEFVGQEHLVGKGKILRSFIESDQVSSMIFWGPPGTGKTTLAHIIANETKSHFVSLSATKAGKKELQSIIEIAKTRPENTILFIDEIHRWNKAQQDALLPHVEDGSIILIGATTENPSFEVNSALLSRCRVFVLNQLSKEEIQIILKKALKDKERGISQEVDISNEHIQLIASYAKGDARSAYNILELAVSFAVQQEKKVVDIKDIKQAIQQTHLYYDKHGEEHYNIISALHKSMRGSDVQASLYWLARMIEGGEDPLYISRRLIRFASEDIGIADSQALTLATSCYQSCHLIGMPECNVILAHTVIYLAKAKKSNAVYVAYKKVQKDVKELEPFPVPLHIRNAPTELMKDLGYGKGYKYNPNYEGDVDQSYLPDELQDKIYFNED